MIVAVIVGILVGLISVLPFRVALKKIRTIDPSMPLSMLGPFLITILASFVILVIGMVACKLLAPDVAMAYSFASIVTFVIVVIVFGVFMAKRRF